MVVERRVGGGVGELGKGEGERKSGVEGESVDIGGRRVIKNKI